MMLEQLKPTLSDDETVAEVIERVWVEYGIRCMPMVPGGPFVPFLLTAYARQRIVPVLVGHEENAALFAEGYYRASGKLAAVGVTAGPGLTNTTTGVAVAFREQSPVFVLSAQVATEHQGTDAAQELNTVAILRPITKASVELRAVEHVEVIVRDLLDLALTPPCGPVHLSVPTDLFRKSVSPVGVSRQSGVQGAQDGNG